MRSGVGGVAPELSVRDAAEKMRTERVGFLPVVSADNRLLGVVTDRDIALRLVAVDRVASETPVSAIMSEGVATCRPDDALEVAEELMMQRQVARIVVTDDLQGFVGVITLADIAHVEEPMRLSRLVRQLFVREYRARAHTTCDKP